MMLIEWLRASRLLSVSESRLIHWHALTLAVALALCSAISSPAQSGITDLVVARKVNLQGNVTPAALTVSVNDYAPAGMTNATFLRLSATSAVNISGLAGGTHGRVIWIINVGTFNITLLDQSALSLAGNRFAIGGPTIIPPGAAVSFWYDGTTALRWMGLVQGKSTTSWGGITGNLSDQTDLNNALAVASQAALTSGVVDEGDTVLFSAPNATTLRIAALQHGVFAPLLGTGLSATAAFKSFAQQDYPLSSLGLVADGTYARWIGYNSSGTVVASTTPFTNDDTIIGLGAVVLKRVGGVTSFIDDGGPRSFATLPQMAGFSELERTYLGYESTVTIAPASNNMTLARSAGVIRGISINWSGLGNKNALDQTAGAGVPFIQVNPALASAIALPAAVTVLTATNYWNGAASVALTANGNASVKRFLLGIKGGLFVQEGEFQYANLDAAVAAYGTAPFTTLLAQDLFIEVGRLAVRKDTTDLSNPTQARFFVTGTGAGGSSGGSPSAVTSITGTVGEINASSPVGAVVISLPAALVFTGKTIAGGTFNSPALVTPALGTPASGVMTNVSGTALALTAGNVVTNANLTGDVTSTGNATTLATVTGTTGAFGSGTQIPVVTVNAKGLVTNITTVAAAAAAAGSLTGTTLAANVVNASLNSITPTGGTLTVTGQINVAGLTPSFGATSGDFTMSLNGGNSGTTGGASIYFKNNGVTVGALGNRSNIVGGGYSPNILLYTNGGNIELQIAASNIATFLPSGLAVTGNISATGAGQFGPTAANLSGANNAVTLSAASGFVAYEGVIGGVLYSRFATSNAGVSIGAMTNQPLNIFSNGVTVGAFSSTGLAVTGDTITTGQFYNPGTASSGAYRWGSSSNGSTGQVGWFSTSDVFLDFLGTLHVRRLTGGTNTIMDVTGTGIAVTGTIGATGNVSTNMPGVDGAGFYLRSNAEYLTSLIRYDTLGSGATLLSSFDKVGIMVGATGAGPATGLLIGTFSTTGLAVTGVISATGGLSASFNGGLIAGFDVTETTNYSGAAFVYLRKSGGTNIGSITRVGTTDAVTFNTTSDARLKTNVRDFTPADSGKLIDALRPRWFDWKSGTTNESKNIIGFIAQEEAAAGAELIRIGAVTPGDPDPTTILKQWQRSDAALVPILVAELKSLRARMAKIEAAK